MRKLLPLLAVLTVTAVAVPAGASSTRHITVGDNYFSPRTVTIKKGTKVTWKWNTDAIHNVKDAKGKFSSGSPKAKGNYSRTFTKKGTYTVLCVVHSEMRETIKVK